MKHCSISNSKHYNSGFSVPAFAARAPARQAVFPVAASLQLVSGFTSYLYFLTPETSITARNFYQQSH
jgi:hypothetical protein